MQVVVEYVDENKQYDDENEDEDWHNELHLQMGLLATDTEARKASSDVVIIACMSMPSMKGGAANVAAGSEEMSKSRLNVSRSSELVIIDNCLSDVSSDSDFGMSRSAAHDQQKDEILRLSPSISDSVTLGEPTCERIYCHRIHLMRIPYFSTIFSKECSHTEKSFDNEDRIEIDLSVFTFATPAALRRMIRFLYSGSIRSECVNYVEEHLKEDLDALQLADYLSNSTFFNAVMKNILAHFINPELSDATILRLYEVGRSMSQVKLMQFAKPYLRSRLANITRLIFAKEMDNTSLLDDLAALVIAD
jgi:hypothetical protein